MSTKFGLLIDFELRKIVTTLNTKPEAVLRQRGCHLEIAYYVWLFCRGWLDWGEIC